MPNTNKIRQAIANWLNPPAPAVIRKRPRIPTPSQAAAYERVYAAAVQSRLTADWNAPNTSADSALSLDLIRIRSRSRQLVRDNGYAKRAKVMVQNNIIGVGIGMQPAVRDRFGKLAKEINKEIDEKFEQWSYDPKWCHTGGVLCLSDMERMLVGQVFEAGEILVRVYLQQFSDSPVPLCLEVIEPERLADEWTQPVAGLMGHIRMGIKRDKFGRPISFFIREYAPGELRFNYADPMSFEEVPADNVFHLFPRDRWPQTRGEPWLHAVARKINDMGGYLEAEIVRARAAASVMGIVETEDGPPPADDETDDGVQLTDLEPGAIRYLNSGEKYANGGGNGAPNPNVDSFIRLMLREIAAGSGPSYESISRDYSQSNFSSSRMGQLEDRDLWRIMQQWFVRSFRRPLHKLWIQQAVLAGHLKTVPVAQYMADTYKYTACVFKTRGWSYIDPSKDISAFKEAVKAGFTTNTDVIAEYGNGKDVEEVYETREAEVALAKEHKLVFDTDPDIIKAAAAKPAAPKPPGAKPGEDEDDPDNPKGEGEDGVPPGPAAKVHVMKRSME